MISWLKYDSKGLKIVGGGLDLPHVKSRHQNLPLIYDGTCVTRLPHAVISHASLWGYQEFENVSYRRFKSAALTPLQSRTQTVKIRGGGVSALIHHPHFNIMREGKVNVSSTPSQQLQIELFSTKGDRWLSALEHHKQLHYIDVSMNDTQASPLFDLIGCE